MPSEPSTFLQVDVTSEDHPSVQMGLSDASLAPKPPKHPRLLVHASAILSPDAMGLDSIRDGRSVVFGGVGRDGGPAEWMGPLEGTYGWMNGCFPSLQTRQCATSILWSQEVPTATMY